MKKAHNCDPSLRNILPTRIVFRSERDFQILKKPMKTRSILIAAAGLAVTQSSRLRHLPTLCLAILLSAALAPAATVANWKVAFVAGSLSIPPTSGLNTASPTFGDAATTNAMDGVGLAGLFGSVGSPESVTLAVDETLIVTAGFTLTGGLTGSSGIYRFSVQNDNGQFAENSALNWGGGILHATAGTGTNASLFSTATGTTSNYMTINSPASNLTPTITRSGTFSADSATAYLWTISITRESLTLLKVVSSMTGGPSSFSEIFTAEVPDPSSFTFNSIGIQTTGQTDLEQLSLANVQYSVIPEPSVVVLGGLGVLCLLRRRR